VDNLGKFETADADGNPVQFSVKALSMDEVNELLDSGDFMEGLTRKIEEGAEEAKDRFKFQRGHRVTVVDGPYEGMYGKVIWIAGCEASCFTDGCKVVYVNPQGNVPHGMERYLYDMDAQFASASGLPEGTKYMSFARDDIEHID
jgi:hypothetical protein